jgi:CheY-like chemotaxis protein
MGCRDLPTMPDLRTLLIVDDDADNRYLLAHAITKAIKECSVVSCASSAEALALVRTRHIDAIVTDHHLGDVAGSEFIGQVRRRGVACPIVMVTASSDPRIEREAYQAGATKVFMSRRGDFANFIRCAIAETPRTSADPLAD